MPRQCILVIDDSKDTQLLVTKTLSHGPWRVESAMNAASALQWLDINPSVDLILLDIDLPDASGFELLTRLRGLVSLRNTPVIFLTGKNAPADKVAGFALGAEDFIVKPFEPLEFRARVEARLAKARTRNEQDGLIERGGLKLAPLKQRVYAVTKNGTQEIELTALEFRILYYFFSNEDRVVTRDQLLDAAWSESGEVVDRTVDKHISKLRRKLGSLSDCIQTVSGAGYRFSPLKE